MSTPFVEIIKNAASLHNVQDNENNSPKVEIIEDEKATTKASDKTVTKTKNDLFKGGNMNKMKIIVIISGMLLLICLIGIVVYHLLAVRKYTEQLNTLTSELDVSKNTIKDFENDKHNSTELLTKVQNDYDKLQTEYNKLRFDNNALQNNFDNLRIEYNNKMKNDEDEKLSKIVTKPLRKNNKDELLLEEFENDTNNDAVEKQLKHKGMVKFEDAPIKQKRKEMNDVKMTKQAINNLAKSTHKNKLNEMKNEQVIVDNEMEEYEKKQQQITDELCGNRAKVLDKEKLKQIISNDSGNEENENEEEVEEVDEKLIQ